MQLTKHAANRIQQRAIPQLVVDLLLQFGATESAGDGATKFFFDHRSRKKLLAYAGPIGAKLNDHLDVYAVVSSSNNVITVAHREERIRRH